MTITITPGVAPILDNGSLHLTVAEVVQETADAVSLVFERPEGFAPRPGQFLTLRVPSEQTGSVARCYSLASSPHVDELPKVTVKRVADGYASNWLCDNVRAGDRIEVLEPAGVFTPDSLEEDLLLVAAGSGITPVLSILKSALSVGKGSIRLVYANRDEASVIFADELRELAQRHPERLSVQHWSERLQGLPSAAALAGYFAGAAQHRVFTCGPAPFMEAVKEAASLAGIDRDRVHAEVFVSLSGDPFAAPDLSALNTPDADAASVVVALDGAEHELSWPRSASLVDVLLGQGLRVPFSCREGECGSCAASLIGGEVDLGNTGVLDPEDIADGIILACQARPTSDVLRVEF